MFIKNHLPLIKRFLFFLKSQPLIDRFLQDQLKRATVSISANIAKGSGRFTLADKRHFYVISRGSAFESFSILQILSDLYLSEKNECENLKKSIEEITRMLFGLIKNINQKIPLRLALETY